MQTAQWRRMDHYYCYDSYHEPSTTTTTKKPIVACDTKKTQDEQRDEEEHQMLQAEIKAKHFGYAALVLLGAYECMVPSNERAYRVKGE